MPRTDCRPAALAFSAGRLSASSIKQQKEQSMRLKSRATRGVADLSAAAFMAAVSSMPLMMAAGAAGAADVELPPAVLGAGVRTSFTHSSPEVGEDIDDFELNSARIYIGAQATELVSLMFNTEFNSGNEEIRVIDAVAQLSFSEQVNIWAGRFLPPSDRANLYGPYYASHWGVYRDGVQDGYPFETEGRDDGLMYWGQFGRAKVSLGAFDVQGLGKGSSEVLYAGRVQLDFWDAESGYYLNGTYYGAKDLLAVGVAAQSAAGDNAYSVDFLLEKKLDAAGGVVTVEAQYAKYDGLGGYPSPRVTAGGVPISYESSDGYYMLGAYLAPRVIGIGRFQLLAKYGQATFDFATAGDVEQTTTEVDLNYIIEDFNTRISLFYIDSQFDPGLGLDSTQIGLGLQVQI
jgi:hypothetical protein